MNEEELKGECDLKVVGMEQNFNEPLEDYLQGLGRVSSCVCILVYSYRVKSTQTTFIKIDFFL